MYLKCHVKKKSNYCSMWLQCESNVAFYLFILCVFFKKVKKLCRIYVLKKLVLFIYYVIFLVYILLIDDHNNNYTNDVNFYECTFLL